MNVTIYTTQTCPFCRQEKEFLSGHNVEYTEHYVDQDREKAQEMIEKSGQMGVPITVITDDAGKEHHVLGFQKNKRMEILNLS